MASAAAINMVRVLAPTPSERAVTSNCDFSASRLLSGDFGPLPEFSVASPCEALRFFNSDFASSRPIAA